jgi:membrane dipeptidase
MNTSAVELRQGALELITQTRHVWDMTLPCIEDYWSLETLRRFKRAGYTFVSATVEDFPATFDGVAHYIARMREIVAAEASWLALATTMDEIERGREEGKLVLGLNLQDAAPIETDLSRVAVMRALGVRHLLLAYNIRNYVADGCAERTDAGLSNFGREVVREMNRVGILVDGSHTGRRSTLEAIELSERPCIFSHSAVYALCPHIRNITDDQIRTCAGKGGVIGVVGNGSFLGERVPSPATMFSHIDYIAELVGPRHVGLGTDFLKDKPANSSPAAAQAVRARMQAKRNAWPDSSIVWPDPTGTQIPLAESGTVQPEQLIDLVALMLAHGYDRDEIEGILGDNFRRVYSTVM